MTGWYTGRCSEVWVQILHLLLPGLVTSGLPKPQCPLL